MAEPYYITPVEKPVCGTIRPPGSKSLTNRALVVASLSNGTSRLSGVLDSRDTEVMIDSLHRLGIEVHHDPMTCETTIAGCAGHPPAQDVRLWLENSGTSIRFLTALATLGEGTFHLDGNPRMRQRPIQDLVAGLNALGAHVACDHANGCPPVTVHAAGLPGGTAQVPGNISSQFLSGLLMAAPAAGKPVELEIVGELVSRPYVEMTLGVMQTFGVTVEADSAGWYRIQPQTYSARKYCIEPDASAASYFFAAAAITGGEVSVAGLSADSLQGDVQFVDALEEMGCEVERQADHITVRGGRLRGIDRDMNAISDTAQTMAVVAVFADGPTRIRNIEHVRHKETDRIRAVATELQRAGIPVAMHKDGLTIHPARPQPAVIETYDDHRMAMSFALLGLKTPGIGIANPDCTAKTYPRFFADLRHLCGTD